MFAGFTAWRDGGEAELSLFLGQILRFYVDFVPTDAPLSRVFGLTVPVAGVHR